MNQRKKIITVDNDIIRSKSREVKNIDNEIKDILAAMDLVMAKHNGIGLAAIQIGIPKRIITIDLTRYEPEEKILKPLKIGLINPKIISRSERMEQGTEGCLSVPGCQGEVERYFRIELEGHTGDGEYFHRTLYHMAARVAQHEIDHLDGILFIDKLKTP